MANINGMFQHGVIRDGKGRTDNEVGGYGNTVSFRGDKGANTFSIGGGANNVDVNNLGKDDRVLLRGAGWQELPDANSRDGVLRFYNNRTGSFAEVRTDDGRGDNFVRQRVLGANPNAACLGNNWSQLGQMDYSYARGFEDGFRAGRTQGHFDVGNFFATLALGPLAWCL